MENFTFHNPTRIVFGKGVTTQLGKEVFAYGNRVLLMYGKGSIKKHGIYQQVIDSLRQNGIQWIDYEGIKPNPSLHQVRSAISICREERLDAVIAVGGGSVVDAAKAVAAGACYDGDVWDGYLKKVSWSDSLPLLVVLTISATGSEMNPASVITNDETMTKASFYSPGSYPKVSFLDPSFQVSLPTQQTIYGAMDMMAHILEAYFNGVPNTDVQDYFAEGLMKTILIHLDRVLDQPENYESRAQLVWSGTLALNGLNAAGRGLGDWSSHRIGHALSACYDFPHGMTLAMIMPAWMRYVYKHDIPKFARFAREVFGFSGKEKELASNGIHAFQEWIKKLGFPTSLTDLGVRVDTLADLARNPSIPYPLGKLKELGPEDVESIFRLTNY